jgi:AcrR family transcriptional regulator
MQELARAAGMSAGNFYRYFPSKGAIVEAIVTHKLGELETVFLAIMQSPDPARAFREGLRLKMSDVGDHDDGIWAEIDAASTRKPEIAQIVGRMQEGVLRYLMRTFAHIAGIPEAEAQIRFAPHAAMIILLVKGTAMTACAPCALGRVLIDRSDFDALVFRVIDLVISEISGNASPTNPNSGAP